MSDHCCEEQEMEAEALAAIFDTAFQIVSDSQPFEWTVKLLPVDCGGDEEEEAKENHVGVYLNAKIPLEYPEETGPMLDIQVIKGLAEEQRKEILQVAVSEAEANEGMPAVFAVCEAVRTWLADNNVKGLDDGSMHAQMMRRAQETERNKALAEQKFEAQKKAEQLTEAENEEAEVRRRRAEGTPCNKENFLAWKQRFEEEMEEKKKSEGQATQVESGRKKEKTQKDDTSDRLTGFQHFCGKTPGSLNLEAIEKAAEDAEDEEIVDVEELDVDEDLFDDDDDLDDLEFDDDDDDDDDEEPDI